MSQARTSLAYTTAQVRRLTAGLLPHDPYWTGPGRIRSPAQLPLPLDLPSPQPIRAQVLMHEDRPTTTPTRRKQ